MWTERVPAAARRPITWLVQGLLMILVFAAASRVMGTLRAPAVKHGARAPVTVGVTLEGTPFDLRAFEGRPVFVNLWASWCGPCRYELPALGAAARAHPEVTFVGLALDSNATEALRLIDESGVDYANVLIDEAAAAHWHISAVPSSVLLDADGRIVWSRGGIVDESDVAAAIKKHAAAAAR